VDEQETWDKDRGPKCASDQKRKTTDTVGDGTSNRGGDRAGDVLDQESDTHHGCGQALVANEVDREEREHSQPCS